MARSRERGTTGVEMLVVVAILVLVSATTLPVVAGALDHERGMAGARYLAARLHAAQLDAVRRGRIVALRILLESGTASLQAFEDGNGNGVLARDIETGIDTPLGAAERLDSRAAGVGLRLNQPVPEIDGTGWLAPGADPLRIGRSSLLSFSPTGSATAGTLYVAAERGPQLAVRVTGASGRIRLLRFDPGAAAWRP